MDSQAKSLTRLSDPELVTLFQQTKNKSAYTELYNRYYTKVERYCLKSFTDSQTAKDATQDVFLKVYEKITTLRKPDLWVAWLFSLTRNVVLNYHKKNNRSKIDYDATPSDLADDGSDMESLYEKERKLKALPQLLDTPDGKLLKMKYVEGRSIEELSQDMHLKKSAVKMRLLRARHHIIDRYEHQYMRPA